MSTERSVVLITGVNGRIGTAVAQRLVGKFGDVVGFDLNAASPPPPDCVRIPVDLASDQSTEEGLRILRDHHGSHIVAVVHLAAYYDFLGKPSPKYEEITVKGTERLLRGLQRENFEVEQFIFSSTMLVHKPGEPGDFITEDWPLGPTWAYPESKVRTEELIRAKRDRIPALILRLAGVYDDVCHSPPLAHQIQRIFERQLAGHLYSGSTSHGQSFVHLEDVVDAIERAIERRAELPPEVAILVGEPEALSYDELQHTFMRLIQGESGETYDVPGVLAKAGAWLQEEVLGQETFIKPWMIDRANDHYALDITRARTQLGWQPRHTLRETLPKMVAALKADPFGWYREHGLVLPDAIAEKLVRAELEARVRPQGGRPVTLPERAGQVGAGSVREEVHAAGELMHACPMHPEVCQSLPGNCPKCGMALEPATPPVEGHYACPMHPEVVGGAPGRCPQCGMALELLPSEGETKHTGHGEHLGHEHMMVEPAVEYTCPMHPEVVSREPGRCPKCGMTLVPRSGSKEHAGHGADEHANMMVEDHQKLLWPHYLALTLGFWLLTSPITLGYMSDFAPDANQLRVMAERGLPHFALRNLAMTWSDMISGLLVIAFSWLSADSRRRFPWAQWGNAFVGGWLLLAPLVFWTPLPEAYANDTLVGGMIIALSVLIPMMPGMSMEGMMGKPDIPPGWAYTPASWMQRMPIAVLAVIGLLIARYLGAYQLGHVDSVWEPFFAGEGGMNGTETIITSDVSKAWPIPDGALGAVVYMLELVMTWMGGRDRWRTMPWMVLALAILILPLGVVSIYFIIIQPIEIGTWCTLCLIAALAMAIMIPCSLDEFVAMGQFLVDARRKGKPFWRTFWTGGAMEGGSDDKSKGIRGNAREMIAESGRGVTLHLPLLLSCAIGVWFMFTRLTFGNSGAMADSDHLVGALVLTFSIMAFAEVARAVRFINVAFGVWLFAAPWLLEGLGSPLALWNGVIGGVLMIVLALPRGRIRDSYAGWNRCIV